MKKSEQLELSVTKLREQLKSKEKLLKQAKKDEEREQARIAYQQKVEEALTLLDLSKRTIIRVDGQQMLVYDFLKNHAQP